MEIKAGRSSFAIPNESPDPHGVEQQVRAQWDHDPALRQEFVGNLSACIAFFQAQARGGVRILGKIGGAHANG